MVTKKELIEEFQKNPNRYWKVKLFDELGFRRNQCKNCGKFFWTLTDQEICNDSTCKPYEFIGNPPTKKKLDYFETWKVIEKFFVKNNHTSIKRYPVVCRWFSPLYFTVAGIVDFYREYNGNFTFEFPANPVILNQPCLRFVDLPNVGLNSKSYTCFLMVQQCSVFNGKQGYWKDECIELDFNLLTKVFGIKPEEIVFIEDVWLGSGAFGSSLEYHVQGIELGNAVFTEFVGSPGNYKEMKEKVIDMGAGYERLVWITQGTPTSYESTFGLVLEKLIKTCNVDYNKDFFVEYAKLSGRINVDEFPNIRIVKQDIANQLKVSLNELEKNTEKLEALYAIADHSRALVFALADGGIVSNVAGGYNLRVILRRALSYIDKFNWELKLEDIATWHIDYLKKMFPELAKHKEDIVKILEVEEKRYKKTKERARRIVETLAGRKLTNEDLIKLYESEGITPEQLGVEVPSDFYVQITEKHVKPKVEEKRIALDVSSLPNTKVLYYKPIYEFKAKVLKVSGNFVVLDQTAFYPRSGGQEPDFGYINEFKVLNVEKIGPVIVHQLEGCNFKKGQIVKCKVDKDRRLILTKHHVATHIINAAARKVLGRHVWQHSAFKDVEKARLDITHYESLSEEEVEKIEKLANKIIEKGLPIKVEILPRSEAEKKYGFEIYQGGGAVPEKILRIVSIGKIDTEACSGTHQILKSTRDVGYVSILRTKRIQDGVDRIEFAAGDVALKYLKEKEKILKEVATKLKVREGDIPKAVKELFEEWKKLRKKIRKRKII